MLQRGLSQADEDTKTSMKEQQHLERQLRHKQTLSSSEDESDWGDSDDDPELGKGKVDDGQEKGLMAMKFMQKARERKRLEYEEMKRGDEEQEQDDVFVDDDVPRKKVFNFLSIRVHGFSIILSFLFFVPNLTYHQQKKGSSGPAKPVMFVPNTGQIANVAFSGGVKSTSDGFLSFGDEGEGEKRLRELMGGKKKEKVDDMFDEGEWEEGDDGDETVTMSGSLSGKVGVSGKGGKAKEKVKEVKKVEELIVKEVATEPKGGKGKGKGKGKKIEEEVMLDLDIGMGEEEEKKEKKPEPKKKGGKKGLAGEAEKNPWSVDKTVAKEKPKKGTKKQQQLKEKQKMNTQEVGLDMDKVPFSFSCLFSLFFCLHNSLFSSFSLFSINTEL